MSRDVISFWVWLSWALAILVVIASAVVCLSFGVAEIPKRYGTETVVNWPVILGCAVGAAYSVLFAVAMSMMRISAFNTRAMLQRVLDQEAANSPEA